MKPLPLAVFASGEGTNLQALIDAIESERLAAKIQFVLSNNSHSGALARARKHNIPAIHLSEVVCRSREKFGEQLKELLRNHNVELIVLAGYMKLVPKEVIFLYRNRIINIHPALLPRFGGPGMYGRRVHEKVLAAGVKESGASVHLVDELYDHGPVILQRTVPVLPDDTPETLAARVRGAEHEILVEAIDLFVQGKVPVPS
jgi:phosphoribosylglycinamide formyltransferase-1